jgi:hypothetical protein
MSDLNFITVTRLFHVCCRSEVKMVQNNGDFTAEEWQTVMKYLFIKGNSVETITIICQLLGNKRSSYSTVKNGVARFRTGQNKTIFLGE